MDKCESENIQENPVIRKPLYFCEFYSQKIYQILTLCIQGEKKNKKQKQNRNKTLMARGKDKEAF